jgi:hypothetical protein
MEDTGCSPYLQPFIPWPGVPRRALFKIVSRLYKQTGYVGLAQPLVSGPTLPPSTLINLPTLKRASIVATHLLLRWVKCKLLPNDADDE